MVVASFREIEITLTAEAISHYQTNILQHTYLAILNKLKKAVKTRTSKVLIQTYIEHFKKLNSIKDLRVYKKK